MNIGEFQLIERIGRLFPNLETNDDTAFIPQADSGYLVLTCDQFTEGVHFLRDWADPMDIGYRAVAAAVSDIFAGGGTPHSILTAIAVPDDIDEHYVEAVYRGIAEFTAKYNVELIGGNITKSPKGFSITTTATGYAHKPLRRSYALEGDIIALTGAIGNTALFLKQMFSGESPKDSVRQRWNRPELRPIENADFIHAACDITDGLAQDLGHILDASGVGCEIHLEKIPLTSEAREYLSANPEDLSRFALSSGEEYVNIVTFSQEYSDLLETSFHPIGRITKGKRLLKHNGQNIAWPKGFDHLGGE